MKGSLYLYQHPSVLFSIVCATPLSYVGIVLVLTLMRNTDALTTQLVTSCRKALTIVLSFIIFSKPFTAMYVLGGALVFGGIYMHIREIAQKKENTVAHRKESDVVGEENDMETGDERT